MAKKTPGQLTLLEYFEETSTEPATSERGGLSLQERESWLATETNRPVSLTFTRNRRQMITWKPDGGALRIRVHEMFREASHDIWCAVVAYFLDGDKLCGRVVDQYIERELSQWVGEHKRPENLRPRGAFHDLKDIFIGLNEEFFHGACESEITWGRSGGRKVQRRKSIQLGVYDLELKLIRIHPCLDQAFVPRFYVRWVVFHEMLHEILGIRCEGGRRQIHPPEFVALEESYPDYAQCMAWQRGNLKRLLNYSAKSG